MRKATNQEQLKGIGTATQDQTIEQASEPAETAIGGYDRITAGVQPAYRTYIEAKKGLAEAFKRRERQDQEAYRDAERRFQLCEEAIEAAMKVREKAELDALDAYREDVDNAVNRASQAYRDKMRQARIECKQRVVEAWRNAMETSAQVTDVFENDRNITKEEQSPGRTPHDGGSRFREMILHLKRSFYPSSKEL